MKIIPLCLTTLLALFLSLPAAGAEDHSLPWPEFRGPSQDGHAAPESRVPTKWGELENVRFRTAIPGEGWSSPVVGDGLVWMTTSLGEGRELRVVAVDAATGEVRHDRVVFEVEKPAHKNELNSYASPTPALAPGRVYVHFGSNGTACLDATTGKTIWERRDLECDHEQGPGSSPILVGDLLVFNMDGVDLQYVVALDRNTGETRWKTTRSVDLSVRRPTMRKGYSTPIRYEVKGKTRLISSGAEATAAYDLESGEEVWSIRHQGFSMSSRPILGDGLVYLNTGYMRPNLLAVRPDGTGDVTDKKGAVAWETKRSVPSMSSPILVDGRIFMATENGTVTALDAATGERAWQKRVGGKFYASPVLVNGLLYFSNREGQTFVIRPGAEYDEVAVNRLGAGCMSSHAVAGNALFIRTETNLYRIEAGEADKKTDAADSQ